MWNFLCDVLSKSNDKENPFINFYVIEMKMMTTSACFWGKILPLCHENKIQCDLM
jgi:hypothetical protein